MVYVGRLYAQLCGCTAIHTPYGCRYAAVGTLHNSNTTEAFKAFDFQANAVAAVRDALAWLGVLVCVACLFNCIRASILVSVSLIGGWSCAADSLIVI
jgi:hypothetical protein